jgi:hypothetical protein
VKWFLDRSPIVKFVVYLPVGLALAAVFKLFGGEGLPTTVREERLLVILGGCFVLAGLVPTLIANQPGNSQRKRRRWEVVAGVVTIVGFCFYGIASVSAQPDPSVRFAESPKAGRDGRVQVTANAEHMTGRQQLVIRAMWPGLDTAREDSSGHSAGKSEASVTVGPVPRPGDARIIAYVTGVGDDPDRVTCGDRSACVTKSVGLEPPVAAPELRTSLNGRRLTIRVTKASGSRRQVIVIVKRRDREVFKDNPFVDRAGYRKVITLSPRRGANDRVCVAATFGDASLAARCRPGLQVVVSRFLAPR